jgi:hypothetical protein
MTTPGNASTEERLAMVLRGIRQIIDATDDEWTRNALRIRLEQAEADRSNA